MDHARIRPTIGSVGANVRAHSDELAFELDADGATWVRGRTYKARFDADGATYIPFLGSAAPTTYPVTLSLADAGPGIALEPSSGARRDGDRIVIERGVVDEVYELSLDGIEHTFVVRERPAAPSLRFHVAVATDLAPRTTAAGFEFGNEFGGVQYGRAFARHGDGSKVALPTRLASDGVEIEVPASVLADAQFPLTIDPLVSTFLFDNRPAAAYQADVACEGSTGRTLVVYTEVFAVDDHDVYLVVLEADQSIFASEYLEFTAEHWVGPKCASLMSAAQFLVVAAVVGAPGTVGSVIRGRTVGVGATPVLGATFNISTTDWTGGKFAVDVGGDPYVPLAAYCVVWQRAHNGTNSDIHARLVRQDSSLVGTGTLVVDGSTGTLDAAPSISKSNGQGGIAAAWTIAWQRDGDIYAARLAYSGLVIDPTFLVSGGVAVDGSPSVSSPREDGTCMIAWLRAFSSDHDVFGALVEGPTILDTANLSFLVAEPSLFEDQIDVSVDSDGVQFALVYSESVNSSFFDYDARISALHTLADQFGVTEAPIPLDASTNRDGHPELASVWGGGGSGTRYALAWDETGDAVDFDISLGLYEGLAGGPVTPYCFGDGSGTACPCGNSTSPGNGCPNSFHTTGSALSAAGSARTGADTLQLQATSVPPNVTCTFFQGSASSVAGTPFGDGLRCAVGTVIRLRTKFATPSGTVSHPVGVETPVHVTGLVPAAGGLRYYQVLYRNSAPFCTTATFNATNGLRVTWIP